MGKPEKQLVTDWGVPDWRDAAAYEPPGNWGQHMVYWRWQFVRRREDVRQAWETGNADEARRLGCWDDPRRSMPAHMPGPRVLIPGPELRRSDGPPLRATDDMFDSPYPQTEIGPNCVDLSFNLDKSIPDQIERAKGYLTELQRRIRGKAGPRKQLSKWPTYLRVIDARDAGETFDEIGAVITDDEATDKEEFLLQSMSNVYKQARNLMFNFPF